MSWYVFIFLGLFCLHKDTVFDDIYVYGLEMATCNKKRQRIRYPMCGIICFVTLASHNSIIRISTCTWLFAIVILFLYTYYIYVYHFTWRIKHDNSYFIPFAPSRSFSILEPISRYQKSLFFGGFLCFISKLSISLDTHSSAVNLFDEYILYMLLGKHDIHKWHKFMNFPSAAAFSFVSTFSFLSKEACSHYFTSFEMLLTVARNKEEGKRIEKLPFHLQTEIRFVPLPFVLHRIIP